MAAGSPGAGLVREFRAGYSFAFDDFQRRACGALAEGRSVLVCAPTGSGKTVVGEFAIWLALREGRKAFYTTPLKALSNQKFGDFIARHGAAKVGLLTGDNSINSEAPVAVMTTEVLRNMLYEGSSTLEGLGVVVMDEVHYLQDPYRGAVWEEVLIHLPPDVRLAALSATVSNAEEFGEWLATVRGDTDVVIETRRPVPLEHLVLARGEIAPLFVERGGRREPNPALRSRPAPRRDRGRAGRGRPPPFERVDRAEVVEILAGREMLPAISFIFSRAGCDQAVRDCVAAGVTLTDAAERERIREYASLRAAVLPDDDLQALGYEEWLSALERGIAAHHAGRIPLFKEAVEELFERALVKMVFATETLSLGINMPAKTVVIERLVKFNGERHEPLTPADYTQLTGRAGRRGIDPLGHALVPAQRDFPASRIAELATASVWPLRSSFRPSYNMSVNLVRRYPVEEAMVLLNLSFAQFLADRSVVRQAREIERNERYAASYRERAACDRGDHEEYRRLAGEVRRLESERGDEERRARADRVRSSFGALRPGNVVALERRSALAAVLEVRPTRDRRARVALVVDEGRRLERLGEREATEPFRVVGRIALPEGDHRSPAWRHQVARALKEMPRPAEPPPSPGARRDPAAALRARLEAHPCHGCPDLAEHERWAARLEDLARDTERLRRRVRSRTETLGRTFERVLTVLEAFGYVRDERPATPTVAPTERGERLARVYSESDLLVAEALDAGVFDGLDAPEIAAVASTLVFETRERFRREPEWPTERVRRAFARTVRLFRAVQEAEQAQDLELCREPDPGFVGQIYWWAGGEALEEVLERGEMSPGDFVRSAKQVWDLLGQLAQASPGGPPFKDAARAVYRGVVAYSGAI
ncbi:MAG: DEAD/DEAH box helicase [Acidobacteria bacterium]|nr:DEAD/DEAH box helicase [Acidobacteriota bacterium]